MSDAERDEVHIVLDDAGDPFRVFEDEELAREFVRDLRDPDRLVRSYVELAGPVPVGLQPGDEVSDS